MEFLYRTLNLKVIYTENFVQQGSSHFPDEARK